jgi:hypothetical protein
MPTPRAPMRSPFDLDDDRAYREWRDRKLADAPASVEDVVVEVRDPRRLTAAERDELVARCRRFDTAVYASWAADEDKEIPRRLGAQLGLRRLDANWLADDDGISSLSVSAREPRGEFIPYTNRAIRWHTDGYYNPPDRSIDAMILHCVRPAAAGGDTALLDHEIAYILLRDADPAHVAALCAPDAMRIPSREDATHGAVARAEQRGPVFSLAASGDLRMRYTHRTKSVAWRDDDATRAAVAALRTLLDGDNRYVLRARLLAGMGLVCNNVLHERTAFTDDPAAPRLLYRARYRDRVAGTERAFESRDRGAGASDTHRGIRQAAA